MQAPAPSPGSAVHPDYVEFELPQTRSAGPAPESPDDVKALRIVRYVISLVVFGLTATQTSIGFGAVIGLMAFGLLTFFMRESR